MLNRYSIKSIIGAAVVLVGITVSSVFYAGDIRKFSHVEHEEYGAECDGCHVVDEASGNIINKTDSCADCHDEGFDVTLPGKTWGPKLSFSHSMHAAAFECIDCHKATLTDKQKDGAPLMTEQQCNDCHEESGIEIASSACKKCHAKDARRMAPKDHTKTFMKTHGRRSPFGSKVHKRTSCETCHKKTECVTCHRTQKPVSHTGLWRMRTHGTAAAFDRDRCRTCHETGSCVFCHRSTAPLNHRGAWKSTHGLTAGSRGEERCMVCHSPAQCAACHRGGQ